MTTEIFAKRLKELRAQNGLSLEQMAEKLNVTAQSLSLYERAKRTINIDLLCDISKQFNVSADYLVGLSDVPSLDTNIQAVCDYTGLSEKAVKNITLINEQYRKDITFEDFVKLSAHKSE